MRFQTTAPTRAQKMTGTLTASMWMTPLPTVKATETPKVKAATKLKKAAQATACRG